MGEDAPPVLPLRSPLRNVRQLLMANIAERKGPSNIPPLEPLRNSNQSDRGTYRSFSTTALPPMNGRMRSIWKQLRRKCGLTSFCYACILGDLPLEQFVATQTFAYAPSSPLQMSTLPFRICTTRYLQPRNKVCMKGCIERGGYVNIGEYYDIMALLMSSDGRVYNGSVA